MTHSATVEIERKYDVDAETRLPEIVGAGAIAVVEPGEVSELVAVYFDTAGLDLGRNRTALRRREGGSDAGWHIKQPAEEGRTEHQWPLTEEGTGVPRGVRDAIGDLIGDRELSPLARVANTRTTFRLLDAAGHPVAELCDDQVRAEDLRAGAVRSWREWEVELLAGAPDTAKARSALLDAIEERVLEAGARPSASSSKLARALGLDGLG